MIIKSAINYTHLESDTSSKAFLSLLEGQYTRDGTILDDLYIYYQKPSFNVPGEEKRIFPSFLIIGKKVGINIILCTSQAVGKDSEIRLKEIDRYLYAHILKLTPEIVSDDGRMLKCSIKSKIFTTNTEAEGDSFEVTNILTNYPDIKRILLEKHGNTLDLSDDDIRYLQATIDGSRSLRKKELREIQNPAVQIKGAILKQIEEEINNFDREQRNAALVTHDGPLRIRGLAGSGKTIILARKVATIHEEDPNAKILVTYNTKVLKEYIQELISGFYRETNDASPNWDKIDIMHAWGGAGLEGVYFNACIDNYIRPINFQEARNNNPKNPFDYVCQQITKYDLSKKYDYCLIDEAQDFNPSFYQLCYKITKHKRIVWAYDEFQNILESDIQNEKETFGIDSSGKYCIDFRDYPNGDSILEITYRNPRLIITSAFSLGMGIYSNTHLVQRIGTNQHWKDLGFNVLEGDASIDGTTIRITRPESSNSEIKNKLLRNPDEIIKVQSFSSIVDEVNEIIEDILIDLKEGLRHDDIMIVCMDWMTMHQYLNLLRDGLSVYGIEIFDLFKGDKNSQAFKYPKMITFSSIHKAKGNESGKVYVIGVDRIFRRKDDIKERNKLFTAITRAKGWVTITGVGEKMDECIEEYKKLKTANFEFKFTQPSEQEVKTLAHDMEQDARRIDELRKQLQEQAKVNNMSLDDLLEVLKTQQK